MQVFDRFKVSDFSLTAEGYLLTPAKLSRLGVQEYYGFEFGLEPADKLFRWHRPADEVFAPEAMRSFMLKPVTVGHPPGGVTATSWKDHAVGSVGLPEQDGDHVRADLLITAPDAINEVQRGTVELSCGYDCDLDFTPGVTDAGEPYDGVMRNIRGNHVAIVPEGRCGPSCKIGDQSMTAITDCAGNPRCACRASNPKGDQHMTTVTIDGATFEVADQKLADAIRASNEATSKMLADVRALLNDANTSLADMKAKQEAADKAAAEAKAAQEAAEKAKPSDADIAKMAADRAALIDTAKKIDPAFEPGDKSAADIRAAVVTAKMGDAAVKDRSADYVAAMFDALAATANDSGQDDPIRNAMKGGSRNANVSPRDAYLASLADAWKPKA